MAWVVLAGWLGPIERWIAKDALAIIIKPNIAAIMAVLLETISFTSPNLFQGYRSFSK